MISPEILRRYPLFAGLDEDVLKKVAMLGSEQEVAAGEWLFREGGKASSLYLVLDGAITLTINMDEKGERIEDVCTLATQEVVGWSALVKPHVYTLGGRAAQKTKVAAIDAAPLRDLMDANPAAGYHLQQNVTQLLAQRLGNLRVQFISMTT